MEDANQMQEDEIIMNLIKKLDKELKKQMIDYLSSIIVNKEKPQ